MACWSSAMGCCCPSKLSGKLAPQNVVGNLAALGAEFPLKEFRAHFQTLAAEQRSETVDLSKQCASMAWTEAWMALDGILRLRGLILVDFKAHGPTSCDDLLERIAAEVQLKKTEEWLVRTGVVRNLASRLISLEGDPTCGGGSGGGGVAHSICLLYTSPSPRDS